MEGKPTKKQLSIGMLVEIIEEGTTDNYLRGYIMEFLTKENTKRGIKVRINTKNANGRVERIVQADEIRKENFIYYNKLFQEKYLFAMWNVQEKKIFTWGPVGEKHAILFLAREKGEGLMKKWKNEGKPVELKRISNTQPLERVLKEVDIVVVNQERKVRKPVFLDWERRLK